MSVMSLGEAPRITITSGVPGPERLDYTRTLKTRLGFTNEDNLTCYRNVILQVLFHLPVFVNWIQVCVSSHVNPDGECFRVRKNNDGVILRPCKICLLFNLYEAFWQPDCAQNDLTRHMTKFWGSVMDDWMAKKQPEDKQEGQEDTADFMQEVLSQLGQSLPRIHLRLLDNIFSLVDNELHMCDGVDGCGCSKVTESTHQYVDVHFTKPKEAGFESLATLVENEFARRTIDKKCSVCQAKTTKVEFTIKQAPEVLFVRVNRVQYTLDKGEFKTSKLNKELLVPSQLIIKKAWLDPRIGFARADIPYELLAVQMHRGTLTTEGHYTAAVKETDGSWTYANDTIISQYSSFDQMANSKPFRSEAYILAFQRHPLITRGPDVSLAASLTQQEYSFEAATAVSKKRQNRRSDPLSPSFSFGGVARTCRPPDGISQQIHHGVKITRQGPGLPPEVLQNTGMTQAEVEVHAAKFRQYLEEQKQAVINQQSALIQGSKSRPPAFNIPNQPPSGATKTTVNQQTQIPQVLPPSSVTKPEPPQPSQPERGWYDRPHIDYKVPDSDREILCAHKDRGLLEITHRDHNGHIKMQVFMRGMMWDGLKEIPPPTMRPDRLNAKLRQDRLDWLKTHGAPLPLHLARLTDKNAHEWHAAQRQRAQQPVAQVQAVPKKAALIRTTRMAQGKKRPSSVATLRRKRAYKAVSIPRKRRRVIKEAESGTEVGEDNTEIEDPVLSEAEEREDDEEKSGRRARR
ncbi:hypothetical protein N7539_007110 [Penicillium diatomitis]|uniref:ubiquitinyl hydrolase 1 n=1 Tax=Penicillium diatomitis TaxID=2819901 RepID=A0A9W9WUI4_9EURO|nr:uncharacterized protein N7539_007110 [Penicillium diatomitis]KAJ5476966.1 hypothetical protein N7539_007110 [Penicillium diatomitis]